MYLTQFFAFRRITLCYRFLLYGLILLTSCSAPESEQRSYTMVSGDLDSLALANPDSALVLIRLYEDLGTLIDKKGRVKAELLNVKLTALEAAGYIDSLAVVVFDLSDYYLQAQDTLSLVDLLRNLDYTALSYSYRFVMEQHIRYVVSYLRNNPAQKASQVDFEILLATILIQSNRFAEARQILEHLLVDNSTTGNEPYQYKVLFVLGEMYFQQGLFEQAKQAYQNALASMAEVGTDDFSFYLSVLGNLGITYKMLEQYDSAIVCYQTILDTLPKEDLIDRMRNTLNLGNVYTSQQQFDKGLEMYEQVLQSSLDNKIQLGVVYSKMNIANLWIQAGDYERALKQLPSITADIERVFSPEILHEANALFEEAYRMNGQFKEAYTIRVRRDLFNDSVRVANNQFIHELELLFRKEQAAVRDQTIANWEEKHKNWTRFSILVSMGAIIIAGLLFWIYRRERKQSRRYQSISEERERVIKERDAAIQEKEQAHDDSILQMRRKVQLLREVLEETGFPLTSDDSDQFWLNLGLKFGLLFPDFEKQLQERYPQLNSADIRYLKLVKLNLPDETIANILNIAVNSVYKRKQRVLEKMGSVGDKDFMDLLP